MIEYLLDQLMGDPALSPLLHFSAKQNIRYPSISVEYEERGRPVNDQHVERIRIGLAVWSSARHYFEAETIADRVTRLVTSLSTIGYGELIYLELRGRQGGRDATLGLWRIDLQFEALLQIDAFEI
jgi:hypothetical protein